MSDQSRQQDSINLEEVQHLVTALEQDLARVQRGEAEVGALRAEVEQLRDALGAAEVPHAQIRSGLVGVRDRLHALGDELFDDAVTAGGYLARLGRLLGL